MTTLTIALFIYQNIILTVLVIYEYRRWRLERRQPRHNQETIRRIIAELQWDARYTFNEDPRDGDYYSKDM